MLRDKFTTEKCVNRLFSYTGRSWRKRCSRRPGNSRRDGELLLLTDKKNLLALFSINFNVLFINLFLPIWIFVCCLAQKGERGSPGDKGPTGPKGKRVSLFTVEIMTYLYKEAVHILRVER